MTNQPTTDPVVVTQYNLRQAIMSVIIGFIVSILTILFQFGIEWLQNIPTEAPGAIVGTIRYWTHWKYRALN
jgi:hypothetical protein